MTYSYDRRQASEAQATKGVRKILRVSPGNRLKTIPEAKKAAKDINAKFPGVTAEFEGGAFHIRVPPDKVADVKAYLEKEYAATATEHGLSAQ